jgi:ketosteroid isomerase-like protein
MKIVRSTALLVSLFLLFTGCKNEETAKFEAEKAALELERAEKEARATIEEANKMIPLLIEQGKFKEASEYFAKDVVQIISGQEPIKGRKAWVQAQKDAAEIGDWQLDLEIMDFQFLGDHVVERGRGIQTFTANEKSPMPSMQITGDYLVFWKKYPDGWKILYDYVVIQSPEQPTAEE